MNKKIIVFLLLMIIILSNILIYKINRTYVYDTKLYNEVYEEYKEIKSNSNTNSITVTKNASSNSNNKKIYIYKNSIGNSYRTIGIIDIPKINISYPIINDYTEANLNISPTKFVGPELNEPGNLVIVAHNNRNKEFFSNLYKLEKDDIITLTDHDQTSMNYKVYDKYEINQTDFSCLDQNTNGNVELTLITCVKFNKNKRLVVKCIAS